jgi:hypothetical protein
MNTAAGNIEPVNFTAVRPTPLAIAEFYLKQFHPGARIDRGPVALDNPPVEGATHRFDFRTISSGTQTAYLGEAASGGWLVKARERAA